MTNLKEDLTEVFEEMEEIERIAGVEAEQKAFYDSVDNIKAAIENPGSIPGVIEDITAILNIYDAVLADWVAEGRKIFRDRVLMRELIKDFKDSEEQNDL
ncbi:MAG: hypothetical protein DRJ03_07370 [Chloroflexi bacterium]|nr:MAG: hypothetical protein DRJ03_07370 [Chloroflexota bacterium]